MPSIKNPPDLIQSFISRKYLYTFLHLLFSEPISIKTFVEIQTHGNLAELAENFEGAKKLETFFKNHQSLTQLPNEHAEYQMLFVGPGPIEVPLWESVYRSHEHLLFDETTFQVREQYHRFGLQFLKENNEPDDHLLAELEFMIFLINCSLRELENQPASFLTYFNAQLHFIEHHFSKWIPKFCKQMLKSTDSLLYNGAALLLLEFITYDFDFLLDLKEEFAYEGN
jgi:putative dimethyl sulfoxide reductase chaperone